MVDSQIEVFKSRVFVLHGWGFFCYIFSLCDCNVVLTLVIFHLFTLCCQTYFVHDLGKKLYCQNVNMHLFPKMSMDILFVLKKLVKGRGVDVSNKYLYIQLHTDKASGPSLIRQIFSDLENKQLLAIRLLLTEVWVWVSAALVVASELYFFQELTALPEYMTAKSITVNPWHFWSKVGQPVDQVNSRTELTFPAETQSTMSSWSIM